MQDHFLFNDSDPKQRGQGCDALCTDNPSLKFRWRWTAWRNYRYVIIDGKKKRIENRAPSQISEARLKDGWILRAVFWHSCYGTEVNRYDERVAHYNIEWNQGTKENPPLLTRLNAQLKAEELFEELGKDILDQCLNPVKEFFPEDQFELNVDNLATDRWGGAGPDCPTMLG